MRFAISAALAFATSFSLVAAQDLTGIPTCAIPCFAAALPGSGCSISDTTCQCTTGRDAIQNTLLTCTPSRCSASDISAIAPAVAALCAKAGITVSNLPTAVASASGSGSGSASASRTASTSASRSASATGAAASSTGAAGVNAVAWGAVVMGVAAGVFGA